MEKPLDDEVALTGAAAGATQRADDDSSSDEGDGPEEGANVQLGFVDTVPNPLFERTNWSEWDGGKIGGWPVYTY
jgi:hypothetical protein